MLLADFQKNNQKWLAAAGLVLTISTYFRMPNILYSGADGGGVLENTIG